MERADTAGGAVSLNPGVRLLWRARNAVQLELGTRAVVVNGVDHSLVARLLDRTGPVPVDARTASVVAALHREGFLVRRSSASTGSAAPTAPPAPTRLAAEFAALRVRHGDRANLVLDARQRTRVALYGRGRLGVLIAGVLAAAGVGHVHVSAIGTVGVADPMPGGLTPSDEGARFGQAAATAIRRGAPDATVGPISADEPPDLAVLACEGDLDEAVVAGLHTRGIPHLAVRAGADHAAVGPLVLPGLTSCLGCAHQHRLDRDPAWSALSLQLEVPRRRVRPADVALGGLAANVAAMQVLSFLDARTLDTRGPATFGGTLEIELPDWRLRRRSWPPHPACDCGAYGAGEDQQAEWPV